jgi:hypothetical protein
MSASPTLRARRKPGGEPTAIELIEEAVQLLRLAPTGTLVLYFAGAIPFVLGLLFFWAHTTWFNPSSEVVAWGALGLAGLFVVMKTAQAEFCARLTAQRLGMPPAPLAWRRLLSLAVVQLRLQPWLMLLTLPVVLIGIPFGWFWAYAQSATVLGDEPKAHELALAQAKLWPGQNHLALTLLTVLAGCMWLNIGALFYAVPWLANRLLGIENIFGFSGWWFLNTTFLASVSVLTWLAMDPLVKAFYTLRVFYGRARRTGEDVRVEFRLAGRASALRAAALVLIGLLVLEPMMPLRAAGPAPAKTVPAAELDQAIDQVLAGDDFRWRLPPAPDEVKPAEGPITRFFQRGYDLVNKMFRGVGNWIKDVVDWLGRRFSSGKESSKSAGAGSMAAALGMILIWGFVIVALGLVLWVIYLVIVQARRTKLPVVTARAVAAAKPDLRDEAVQAALLPTDGWLALAKEEMARGEWRLAWRALYLATLARLSGEGLLALAKHKTNLDYERELRRRALSRQDVVKRFSVRRRGFEDVWYGQEQVVEGAVREWMAELERPDAP